jgi:hypothetical protein
MTAQTPGIVSALLVSIRRIRPLATGERIMAPWIMPGSDTSTP